MSIDPQVARGHKLVNWLQSLALLAAMALLFAVLGYQIAGPDGVTLALVIGAMSLLMNSALAPGFMLRLYGARPLAREEAPGLYRMVERLADRAGLPAVPELWYLPSGMINAFTMGRPAQAIVCVTDGLLRALTPREVNGVLAHEVSHIRNNDMWVMGLADLFARLTSALSTVGQVLLIVNLPLILFSEVHIGWGTIALLIFAPGLSVLLQLALSRTREYDADLDGAMISGDPEGLAMALEKIERFQGRVLEQIFMPGRGLPEPSLLRTHPPTAERVRRLLALTGRTPPPAMDEWPATTVELPPAAVRPPRWHLPGLWY